MMPFLVIHQDPEDAVQNVSRRCAWPSYSGTGRFNQQMADTSPHVIRKRKDHVCNLVFAVQ